MEYSFNMAQLLMHVLSPPPLLDGLKVKNYDLHEDDTLTVSESYQKGVDAEES